MRSSLRFSFIAALALVAGCGADSSPLIDSGLPLDEVEFDAGEQPDTSTIPDVADSTATDAVDATPDQPSPSDASTDRVDATTTDIVDASTADTGRIDVVTDTPRDVAPDIAPDVARDVPVDRLLDAGVDAPPDVPAIDVAPDVARDVPPDIAQDVPVDRGVMDVPVDAPRDVPVDMPRDVPVDIARDVPADNGCGALARCGSACVDTRTDPSHCGGCGDACPGADNACRRRTCAAGTCGVSFSAVGVRCPDTATSFCDGTGNCVECLRGSDCASGVCSGGRCQSPTCTDRVRNGMETGVDCGGPACPVCPVLLALAGGTANLLAGVYDASAGAWVATPLAGRTVDGVALATTSTGQGVGLVRFTQLGSALDNQLQYTVWNGASWAALRALGPTVTTQGAPAITRAGAGVHAAFHGFDFNHYFAAFDGAAWNPTAEPTMASGARAGAVARLGANTVLVYSRGLSNELQSRTRTGTTWGDDRPIDGGANFDFNVSPTAVALDDSQVLAAWVATSGQVRFSSRTVGGAWSSPANAPMCLTRQRVALAPVGASQALMAFHGLDDGLYVSTYTGGSWSAPARVVTPIAGAPAVARGLPGATAELAWIDASGRASHTRLVAGAWQPPVSIGGASLVSVALASAP